MELGYIKPRKIVDEMKESYLDYAMSVIVSRALPDVRDGLKPVHRRILYAMWDVGLKNSAKYRKSATVVGEVLGKYHPHGDLAVYESLVRMAQYFSMRYTLVDGQGNFGSMDGDSAAAMRYTECKMDKIAEEMMVDIEKETVNFIDNYDQSHKEPTVLPAKLPNALLNGTMGIAVGMATNIPPHNLGELIDGITYLIDNPKAIVEDLIQFVKGPDFPTGGIIFDKEAITQAYTTGKGPILMRAKADIVERKEGQFNIVVEEIPFQVNKATLIEKIAHLVTDKKIEGIKDVRDESDKDGLRIVIELRKDAYPKKVLNRLYTLTQLQDKFYVNMLALVDGIQPRVLNLKQTLGYYIEHRQEVVVRRIKYELKKAKEREHILEGLSKALDHIDEVIAIIKKSSSRDNARDNLIKRFKFTKIQSEAILDMRLSQLAALERKKIEDELKALRKLIKELEAILQSKQRILNVIKEELADIKERFADERKTKVIKGKVDEFVPEDLIDNENVVITLTRGGYIKSLPASTYKSQGRGGKGIIGMATKEEDVVENFFMASTHSDILFFTDSGKVFKLKAYEVPQSSRTAKGNSIVNFLQLSANENVAALIAIDNAKESSYMAMVTEKGLVKKVRIEDLKKVRRSGLIAIKIKDDDKLKWVRPTSGKDELIVITQKGQAIRFSESKIRPMGRTSMGVRGIRLKNDDKIVGMNVIDKELQEKKPALMIITENGYGKRTNLKQYKIQGRGGSGIKTAKITAKNGNIVRAQVVTEDDKEIIVISGSGQVIRMSINGVPNLGRATQGVRVMRLKADDKVASIACI
ncbi:MAG: DNA gyrase subunit A [Parcubacteria group bacterium]|nr:DNA gyrase subunit A [Parcubacteria group bacterium]